MNYTIKQDPFYFCELNETEMDIANEILKTLSGIDLTIYGAKNVLVACINMIDRRAIFKDMD